MKRLKSIAKGLWRGIKDVAPIPTREMAEGLQREWAADTSQDQKDRLIQMLTRRLTSLGGMVLAILYVIDQIFKIGLFG